MADQDDDFQVRPGRIGRDRRAARSAQRFVAQVSQAVQAAGGRSQIRRATRTSGGRGRGRAWRLAALTTPARRAVIKARVVRQFGTRFRAASLARHLRYLQREGVTKSGEPAQMFDAAGDQANAAGFAKRCEDDRHHFRFIVSPEDAGEMADLRAFTRELMDQAAEDLGVRLDWVAIDHWNTDNPHVHVLLRGVSEDGADLVIDKAYISRGLRERAERLVELELGPRRTEEIERALLREVSAERLTHLDKALRGMATEPDALVDLRPGDPAIGEDLRSALVGRLSKLTDLGLATRRTSGVWTLAPDLEPTLRDLALRGDLIKTLHQAMAREGREVSAERLVLTGEPPPHGVTGRLVERGLHDELQGSAYAVVDGLDGRLHHLRFETLEATGDAAPGAVVALRTWTEASGRARHGLTTHSDLPLAAQIQADGATWLDRQLVAREPAARADGFGAEVTSALTARQAVLVERGHASTVDGTTRHAPKLLETLREVELTRTRQALALETGQTPRIPQEGDTVAGVYRRRLDLASGRFAMIDDGLGFSLVPWRPSLERHRGQAISGAVAGGGIDWSLGRARGPGL
ncbi:DUF3363 domain-containing protein [Caulobacter sp. RHG1]|uniref:relaxase/mobilization nuclease domain-containing protein n=1 Tax=Caulobacter sp. (strain RHG1) TaxID=2545762 RepID=UPI0015547E60|nr:Type IV secretory pathway, VirD2 components (relaxase) [Caulobacter sp. RHG1]